MGTPASFLSIFSGALSFICTVGSIYSDCWQVNSKGSVVLSRRCRGLWSECVWDKFVKIWTCDVFSSYLNPHPEAIITTRALLIASAITGTAGFLCLLAGCPFFRCLQEGSAKQHCLGFSVGCYILAGLLSCIGVIRYATYIFLQHRYEVSLRIPGFPSFEYGYSLWMAVAGTLAALVSAFALCYQGRILKVPSTSSAGKPVMGGPERICTYV